MVTNDCVMTSTVSAAAVLLSKEVARLCAPKSESVFAMERDRGGAREKPTRSTRARFATLVVSGEFPQSEKSCVCSVRFDVVTAATLKSSRATLSSFSTSSRRTHARVAWAPCRDWRAPLLDDGGGPSACEICGEEERGYRVGVGER